PPGTADGPLRSLATSHLSRAGRVLVARSEALMDMNYCLTHLEKGRGGEDGWQWRWGQHSQLRGRTGKQRRHGPDRGEASHSAICCCAGRRCAIRAIALVATSHPQGA